MTFIFDLTRIYEGISKEHFMLISLSPYYRGIFLKIATSALVTRASFCILMNSEYFTCPNVHRRIELLQCKLVSC